MSRPSFHWKHLYLNLAVLDSNSVVITFILYIFVIKFLLAFLKKKTGHIQQFSDIPRMFRRKIVMPHNLKACKRLIPARSTLHNFAMLGRIIEIIKNLCLPLQDNFQKEVHVVLNPRNSLMSLTHSSTTLSYYTEF